MPETRDAYGGEYLFESLRSSGYDPVYALAEIIDNSIEAKAKNVEVICMEEDNYGQRTTKKLDSIAIVDDGYGMSEDELWDSLRMGEGTRRQTGTLGKFGMGLHNASISQCKKVEVYSWRSGGRVMYTFLGPESVKGGKVSITKPTKATIPNHITTKSNILQSKSGTLVVWSGLDRIPIKKGKTLIGNSELVIGRIYRKQIIREDVKIRMASFYKGEIYEKYIKPNDPLYQMVPSSTPSPFDNKKMFQHDGDRWIENVKMAGHNVQVSYAYVTKEGRDYDERGLKAGSQLHGKHADSNLGISIVREDRELYLDTNLCQTYDPMERWWGVEVSFTKELDDVFNVTNSKQVAVNFSTMTKRLGSKLRIEEEPDESTKEERDLYNLVSGINSRIRQMRQAIKKMKPRQTTKSRRKEPIVPWPNDPDTQTGGQSGMTAAEKERAIAEALSKFNPEGASERAKEILRKKLNVTLERSHMGDDVHEFFTVEFLGGVAIITLNVDHPLYQRLLKYTDDPDSITDAPNEQLDKIKASLNSIIYSWARLENATQVAKERANLRTTRNLWGRQLYEFFNELYE